MGTSIKNASSKEIARTVMDSEKFKKAMTQEHHFDTTLGQHTIEVAKRAMKICKELKKRGVEVDSDKVLTAALCHDLGMVGRYELYKNNLECCKEHPEASVREAEKLFDDLDEVTKDAIRSHMWPLSKMKPKTIEGWVLTMADKEASSEGTINHLLSLAGLKDSKEPRNQETETRSDRR